MNSCVHLIVLCDIEEPVLSLHIYKDLLQWVERALMSVKDITDSS